jgi:hypothetical protein
MLRFFSFLVSFYFSVLLVIKNAFKELGWGDLGRPREKRFFFI